MTEQLIYRRSQFEKDVKEGKPLTTFQSKVLYFMIDRDFRAMYVDEDGEIIMERENKFSIREFRSNSKTHILWQEIQDEYNKGAW
jgi:hypothetical protein